MDLGSLTPQQRACVQHVSGPLLVSAGAGSGKTFMLTQRIAYALLNPQESGVSDVGEVLAITFTELAASEIKARVRNKLREEGLFEQALKVDASWISTIHGMCSRILHENALELGLDPAFSLLDDMGAKTLLRQCVDDVLKTGGRRALTSEYGPDAACGMVEKLLGAASNVRRGLDAVRCAPVSPARAIATDMYDALMAFDACGREDISTKGKQGTNARKIRDVAESPEYGMAAFERLGANKETTYEGVYRTLALLAKNSPGRIVTEPFATAAAQFRLDIIRCMSECEMGLALPAREELLELARDAGALYEARKNELGALDQDDLLLKTLDAFENHPDVQKLYRDRFHLVMVDEFQDTSALQIAIVSHLTDGDARLCTVGDTQQSIYRFRGADVATYLGHKAHMRSLAEKGSLACELDRNFRSHGDVIEFVNRVFGQEDVFDQSEFIKLGYDEKHAERPGNEFPDVPRIDVLAVCGAQRGGASSDQRVLVEAEGIARRFEALHEDGAPNRSWGDMVVLLGRMSKADIYARTLRAHGIPCTVAGGSGFAKTAEALAVRDLLAAIANPLDDAAMGAVLRGPAFGMGADDLIALGIDPQGGFARRYWRGLSGDERLSARGELARALLVDAVHRAASTPASELLCNLAVASGWLERLQGEGPQGMAQAANFLKALRLVEDLQEGGEVGVAEVAKAFADTLGGLRDRPGALNARAQNAVRIMTIHSSKGLEFPIVACADYNTIGRDTDKLALETAGEDIYLSLAPDASAEEFEKAKPKLTDAMAARLAETGELEPPVLGDEDLSASQLHEAIKAHAGAEEIAELRRKFYVGVTRPRETLIVTANIVRLKDGDRTEACIGDLRRALFGQGAFASAPDGAGFGGRLPAKVERLDLTLDGEGGLLVNAEPASGYLSPAMLGEASEGDLPTPRVPEAPRRGEHIRDLRAVLVPHNPLRAGTFSYSSLAAADPACAPEDRIVADGASPAATRGVFHEDAAGFGSAVHQACQIMLEDLACRRRAGATDAALAMPPEHVLERCLKTWVVSSRELGTLKRALSRWLASDVAGKALGHATLIPEAPFFVTLQGTQGEPVHLEGAMDLLCLDHAGAPAGQTAFVVDYKTGGSPGASEEELLQKHGLQARCYAYALLSQGFEAAELAFVLLEAPDASDPAKPRSVAFRYTRDDLQELHEHIRACYARL